VEPLLALSVRHATGDWGFSFASRINVDTLIQMWLPTTLIVIGAAQHSTNNRRTGVGHRVPSYVVDPTDPWPDGCRLSDTWGTSDTATLRAAGDHE